MKKIILVSVVIIAVLFLIKRKDMTWRQSILKTVYPLIMLKGKLFPGKNDVQVNTDKAQPAVSFYSLKAISNKGDTIDFSAFRGKKILIVNTASDCGFTGQYDELENIHQQYKDKLIMLAFPANDFKEQEKKDDAAIAEFCKINYGITFPLMQKSHVVKGADQNPVFAWLSNASQNGWCNQQPVWNFSKYVIDENGVLTHFFSQTISPVSKDVQSAIR
ncbi:MAG: glutathione peroxidase [Bacteroidota bacterium]